MVLTNNTQTKALRSVLSGLKNTRESLNIDIENTIELLALLREQKAAINIEIDEIKENLD